LQRLSRNNSSCVSRLPHRKKELPSTPNYGIGYN